MDADPVIKEIEIIRFEDGKSRQIKDAIIDEEILSLVINENPCFKMVCSMTDIQELSAGFLFTQGIIHQKKDIKNMEWKPGENRCCVTLTPDAYQRVTDLKKNGLIKGSSGGSLLHSFSPAKPMENDNFSITPAQVISLIESHWNCSKRFQKTGAVHSAGLCDLENTLFYYEDIGRHNAVDKLAGSILLNSIDTFGKVATVSCRMSLEIVGKIVQTGITVLISNAAPTLSAVKLADKAGLTMIGFARGNRFNIYTHEQRVQTA